MQQFKLRLPFTRKLENRKVPSETKAAKIRLKSVPSKVCLCVCIWKRAAAADDG